MLLASLAIGLASNAEASAGLGFSLGETGLSSLSYDSQPLVASDRAGTLRPVGDTPRLQAGDGAITWPREKPRTYRNANGAGVTLQYSWGFVECAYSQVGDRLHFDVRVTNASSATVIQSLDLQLLELTFKAIPQGRILDAGMFGQGGNWRPLDTGSLAARSSQMPPVIFVRFESGILAFANDGDPGAADSATVSIPFTTNPTTKLSYPFRVTFPSIAAGKTARAALSMTFGGSDASSKDLAGNVLQAFRDAYPYFVSWKDRRPIGALFLATSQKHPQGNPRGWFQNAKDVDLTTPEGLAKWRARLMKYADDSIKVLKSLDAQGMITWDPEGEEFANATYYGDPRLASRLAPETDLAHDGTLGALDEYFQKFRDAGLRTGLTLRPQAIAFKDGVPSQHLVDDPTQELLDRIDYARKRWGCTLFYLDSTYGRRDALDAEVMETIARRHPDVLLMPENENLRYFVYSAPLNSFQHQGVTGTPASVREVYSQAFSVLLATGTEEQMRTGHDALVESVKRGDILVVHAASPGKSIESVKGIYRDAGS